MKLEKFETEYTKEIEAIKSLRFADTPQKPFLYPAYQFVYRKALAFAFAMPAFAFVFAFFFYTGNQVGDASLATLEASNQRILNQINSLDE